MLFNASLFSCFIKNPLIDTRSFRQQYSFDLCIIKHFLALALFALQLLLSFQVSKSHLSHKDLINLQNSVANSR